MGDFNDVFRRYGEEFDFYKNLPLVVYNERREIEEYVEEKAWELIDEDYTEEEWESLSEDEVQNIVRDYIFYVEQTEFHNILDREDCNNLLGDVYDFEDETGIPVYVDRRRYGELQVCVDEDSLTEEEVEETKEFFKSLIHKYKLYNEVDAFN